MKNVRVCVVLMCVSAWPVLAAGPVNLLNRGDVEGGWVFINDDPLHVTESMIGNGRGGYGNALSFTDSTFDWNQTSLEFRAGNGISSSVNFIPNNAVVYVGAWVKVAGGFAIGDSAGEYNSGVEVYLRVADASSEGVYQSNTDASLINSLTFGFNHVNSIPAAALDGTWRYFEFPVTVGAGSTQNGWTFVELRVADRVGWRGDLAAAFTGTIYIDDMYVGLTSQKLELADPQTCGDFGTSFLPQDINKDCYVNVGDLAEMAQHWLGCTDPTNTQCNSYWQ